MQNESQERPESITPDASLERRLAVAETYRATVPIDEPAYPDMLERAFRWFHREMICAHIGWAIRIGAKFQNVAQPLGAIIIARGELAAGKPVQFEELAENVWAVHRALDALEVAMPESFPPERHAGLRAAVDQALTWEPVA